MTCIGLQRTHLFDDDLPILVYRAVVDHAHNATPRLHRIPNEMQKPSPLMMAMI